MPHVLPVAHNALHANLHFPPLQIMVLASFVELLIASHVHFPTSMSVQHVRPIILNRQMDNYVPFLVLILTVWHVLLPLSVLNALSFMQW